VVGQVIYLSKLKNLSTKMDRYAKFLIENNTFGIAKKY